MDKDLQDYYERQFDMMSHEGWTDFLATVEAQIQNLDNVMTVKDQEDLYKRQGKLDILVWIKSWKSLCETAYKDNQDEADL